MLKLKTKENIDKVTTVERFGSSQLFKLFYNCHKSNLSSKLLNSWDTLYWAQLKRKQRKDSHWSSQNVRTTHTAQTL